MDHLKILHKRYLLIWRDDDELSLCVFKVWAEQDSRQKSLSTQSRGQNKITLGETKNPIQTSSKEDHQTAVGATTIEQQYLLSVTQKVMLQQS